MIVFHALGLALGPTTVRCKDGATILFTCKSSAPQHDIPRRDEVDLSTVGSCKMMKVFPAQASVGETWRRCARTCARTQERQGSNSPGKPHTRVKERHLRLRVRHGSGAHECDAVSQKKNELLVRNGACACLKQVTLTAGNLQAENESFATVAAPFPCPLKCPLALPGRPPCDPAASSPPHPCFTSMPLLSKIMPVV